MINFWCKYKILIKIIALILLKKYYLPIKDNKEILIYLKNFMSNW
jgi:hypothetical protein